VEKYSKNEIQILREDVEQSVNIAMIVNPLEKHLPSKLVEKAKDPKALHEHILGFTLGTANSLIAVIDILYQIGAGIIKAPYHLYLVLS
jgi:hypothetical protein